MAANCESLFNFYWIKNLVKRENYTLVSLATAFNSSELITFKKNIYIEN